MATKAQLVELVRRRALQNGIGVNDDNARLTYRQVELELDQTFQDLIFLTLKASENDLNSYAKTYNNLNIKFDGEERVYYVKLPAEVIQLPNNIGIRLVQGVGENARKFYRTSHEDIDMFMDTFVPSHYDRPLYIKDKDRLLFKNFDFRSHNVRKIILKLVVPLSEYGDDEDVSLPAGRQTEFLDIVAKKLYSDRKFLDKSADLV